MRCQHTATDLSLASTRIFRKFVKETCQSPGTPLTSQKKKHCTTAATLLQRKLVDGYEDMAISVIKLVVSGSEGTVICRLRNSWEWTVAEYVATKRLEAVYRDSDVAGQTYWRRKDGELLKPHTMSCEEIPRTQLQAEMLFWGSIVEWFLFSSTPAEASVPTDKIIRLHRPSPWPGTAISYIPNPRVKMEINGSQSEQRELQNVGKLSYISVHRQLS